MEQVRSGLPYIEPASGKHAAELTREESRKQAIEYVRNGMRHPRGWGKHRISLYDHFRYHVTEAA